MSPGGTEDSSDLKKKRKGRRSAVTGGGGSLPSIYVEDGMLTFDGADIKKPKKRSHTKQPTAGEDDKLVKGGSLRIKKVMPRIDSDPALRIKSDRGRQEKPGSLTRKSSHTHTHTTLYNAMQDSTTQHNTMQQNQCNATQRNTTQRSINHSTKQSINQCNTTQGNNNLFTL